MKLTTQILHQLIGDEGKIFNVTFLKKDGTIRTFNARLGVYSYCSNKGTGLRYAPEKANLLNVFSLDDLGYRMVNVDKLIRLKANGIEVNLDQSCYTQ